MGIGSPDAAIVGAQIRTDALLFTHACITLC